MKPIIGIIEWPYYDKDNDKIYEVMSDVVNWVNKSGGIPVGIFPTQVEDFVSKKVSDIDSMNADEADDLLSSIDRCDAIIKPGALRIYNHERLIHEYTVQKNMPYLGICAGMQIMAAYHYPQENIKNETFVNHRNRHNVRIYHNTLLEKIINKECISVISRHNYHIFSEGINKVAAVAEDGIIEAIENPNCSFNLGVQWHPELEDFDNVNSQNIFGELIEQAKTYSKRK